MVSNLIPADTKYTVIEGKSISLQKKYDLLCLLVANKGRVLTYDQVYQKIWNEDAIGNESNVTGCHIRNLREKLFEAAPEASFTIRCVREVGLRMATL